MSQQNHSNRVQEPVLDNSDRLSAIEQNEQRFPIPLNETERLRALHQYNVLDSMPEQDYDDLTMIAAQVCGTPISLISLLDQNRQWFKSRQGMSLTETPRDQAFCSHAILTPNQVMVVPDARLDQRFVDNPLVTSAPNVQFYAGAPIVTADGFALGTICVLDQTPRQLSVEQINALQALSRQVMTQLEIRSKAAELQQEIRLRAESESLAIAKSQELAQAFNQLQKTQASLIQSEKMSALGQLVAGICHEINNPVNFIAGNLPYCKQYTTELLQLIKLYQAHCPQGSPEIAEAIEEIDLGYLANDFPNLLNSMENGARRIKIIVQSLRTFSHLDETGAKSIDLHENLDAILTILENQFQTTEKRPYIQIIKNYGQLPLFACQIKDLNQAFIQIFYNAIDALAVGVGKNIITEQPTLVISTALTVDNHIRVAIADNGQGMTEGTKARIFEPFYTTKPIGKGTGMGLAMSYQTIVERHGGTFDCVSELGRGAEFIIEIPLRSDLKLEGVARNMGIG